MATNIEMNSAQTEFCKRTGAKYLGSGDGAYGKQFVANLKTDETLVWATERLLINPDVLDWFAIPVNDFSDLRQESKLCSSAAWHAYGNLSSTAITSLSRLEKK